MLILYTAIPSARVPGKQYSCRRRTETLITPRAEFLSFFPAPLHSNSQRGVSFPVSHLAGPRCVGMNPRHDFRQPWCCCRCRRFVCICSNSKTFPDLIRGTLPWPGDASGDEPERGVLSIRPSLLVPQGVSEGVFSPGGEPRWIPQPPSFCFVNAFSWMSFRPDIVVSCARDRRQCVHWCVRPGGAPTTKSETHPLGNVRPGVFVSCVERRPTYHTSEDVPGCCLSPNMSISRHPGSNIKGYYRNTMTATDLGTISRY